MRRNNQLSWKQRYNIYLTQYNKKQRTLGKIGLTMYDKEYSSVREFKEEYLRTKNTLKQEIKEGKRTSVGNVQQYLISKQAYKYSQKQVKALFESDTFIEEHGDDIDELSLEYSKNEMMRLYRSGELLDESGWFDAIRAERQRLFESGLTKEQVRKAISQTFYGSE